MKNILAFLFFAFLLASCASDEELKHNRKIKLKNYKIFIRSKNDLLNYIIRCDSFQMISTTECVIWNDAHKSKVIGWSILPETNY